MKSNILKRHFGTILYRVSIRLVLLRIAHNSSYLAYMTSLFFRDSLPIFSLKIDSRAVSFLVICDSKIVI